MRSITLYYFTPLGFDTWVCIPRLSEEAYSYTRAIEKFFKERTEENLDAVSTYNKFWVSTKLLTLPEHAAQLVYDLFIDSLTYRYDVLVIDDIGSTLARCQMRVRRHYEQYHGFI